MISLPGFPDLPMEPRYKSILGGLPFSIDASIDILYIDGGESIEVVPIFGVLSINRDSPVHREFLQFKRTKNKLDLVRGAYGTIAQAHVAASTLEIVDFNFNYKPNNIKAALTEYLNNSIL